MTYEELCKHFDRNRPACKPVGKRYWFTGEFQSGNDCVNDILIRWLKEWHIPYLRVYLGEQIWFLFQGQWTRTISKPRGDKVDFYLLEYVL